MGWSVSSGSTDEKIERLINLSRVTNSKVEAMFRSQAVSSESALLAAALCFPLNTRDCILFPSFAASCAMAFMLMA